MDNRIDTFANRLKLAMDNKNINQVELAHQTTFYDKTISQSLINKYLKGKAFARQNNIYILSKILDVDEAWLMGYDVPIKRTPDYDRKPTNNPEIDYLYDNTLTEEEKKEITNFIEYIKNKRKNK